jgi:hypothetical protein
MASRATRFKGHSQHELGPVERAVLLIALDLDPEFTYTDHELQTAWRRRKAHVKSETDKEKGGTVAAINAAYVTLIGQAQIPRPIEVRL